ncbi:DnaJ-domain-containing protein [Coprinopsis marcescibilis]|uniref:DnaJ-domain-containing protein n=1 Tax=Coprinopsis marcescibilis TaxID=230819 RepID=A0A5C3KXM7_COPMA|nr:DnaJ-domain-containing protein [Coprinopsis marcescibilis]
MLSPSLSFCAACRHRRIPGVTRIPSRFLSTPSSSNAQYPFPSHRNPTPHDIFHLPRNATEADIKTRYFELVRLYHPDKPSPVSADIAHQRFQQITNAYDILRGKKASGTIEPDGSNPSVDLRYQTTAAWRTMHKRRSQELYRSGAADEKWKDRIILAGVIGTILFVIHNTWTTRREVMQEAYGRTHRAAESYNHAKQAKREERRTTVEESRLSQEDPPNSR